MSMRQVTPAGLRIAASALLAAVLAATPALAQSGPGGGENRRAQPRQSGGGGADAESAPPLRGPAVRERNVPGVAEGFTMEGQRRAQAERIPPPVFMEALRSLANPETPDHLRATPEQMEKLRGLREQFEEDRRQHAAQHRDEIRRLRAEMADQNRGQRPAAGGEPPPAAQRLREIEQSAPRPEQLYTRVWEELTEAQRTHVDAQLDEFRARRAREREEEMVLRRVPQDRRPAPDDQMQPRGPGADDRRPEARAAAERRQRLLRIFEQLSPEEQERILQRLENMLRDRERGQGPARPDGEAPRRARRPAPPPMDEVNVPSPEDPPEQGTRRPRRGRPD